MTGKVAYFPKSFGSKDICQDPDGAALPTFFEENPPELQISDPKLKISDEDLATRTGNGDKTAFAQLVARHSNRFYAFAYRSLRNRHEAEDVVQNAFLKFWTRPHLWDAERGARFTTWFYQILLNMARDVLRGKKVHVELDTEAHVDKTAGADMALVQQQQQATVAAHIAALPQRQREALLLCFYEGLSNQEAARVMDISVKALESLLMRGKQTLKTQLGENDT